MIKLNKMGDNTLNEILNSANEMNADKFKIEVMNDDDVLGVLIVARGEKAKAVSELVDTFLDGEETGENDDNSKMQ